MPRLVISTVGTSLLTNQIDRQFEEEWYTRLRETANYPYNEVYGNHEDIVIIIETLKDRVEEKLKGDVEDIREASAELNGIYALYENDLKQGQEDIHYLIATDTAQGKIAAEIVCSFLVRKGIIQTSIEIPPGFSLANSYTFLEGVAKLFSSIKELILDCRKDKKKPYQICFNLVGSFKAIQGYFNTIGMFYADEIIYVFEGSNEIIKIPKLPIKVDPSVIEPYKVQLAMMSQGDVPASWEEVQKVPKDWVLIVGNEITLSTWGQLLWEQCKNDFFSQDKPLKFSNIEYTTTFLENYQSKPSDEKVILQENLARAACLLINNKDGISAMKQDGIFRLRRYLGEHKNIDHFDLPKDRRISCIALRNKLQLRHYGEHNYVNNNP